MSYDYLLTPVYYTANMSCRVIMIERYLPLVELFLLSLFLVLAHLLDVLFLLLAFFFLLAFFLLLQFFVFLAFGFVLFQEVLLGLLSLLFFPAFLLLVEWESCVGGGTVLFVVWVLWLWLLCLACPLCGGWWLRPGWLGLLFGFGLCLGVCFLDYLGLDLLRAFLLGELCLVYGNQYPDDG